MNAPPVSCRAVGEYIKVSIEWGDGTRATSAAIKPADGRALLSELNDAITAADHAAGRKALEAAGQQRINL